MNLSFEGVKPLQEGAWITKVSAKELSILRSSLSCNSDISVLLVNGIKSTNDGTAASIAVEDGVLVSVGESGHLLIIDRASIPGHKSDPRDKPLQDDVDELFISELAGLDKELRQAGYNLLCAVRDFYNTPFEVSKTGKYVQKPENFWAARVQPRVKTIAITVYGEPDKHRHLISHLDIRKDRGSYSRFTVANVLDANEAVQVIHNALRMKQSQ